ncbi:Brefeldin A resistance protein [Psilocybe cubensis]|uniref:Brefeldin A resistance protein n=2 Tax=Psilocybe cubensis TaxID=181762 RepID=A0ACB8GFN0_PSICU|nr:Brefeldin A resistance protein [Psilocybe cubensis]KAH9474468.1 Brefeldin A resistance protein [Psilocybe cubensis]
MATNSNSNITSTSSPEIKQESISFTKPLIHPTPSPAGEKHERDFQSLSFQAPPAVENKSRPGVLRNPHSHVSFDYFDPQGVLQLSRTLSQTSSFRAASRTSDVSPDGRVGEREKAGASEEGRFDFEKHTSYQIPSLPRQDESDIKSRTLGVSFDNLRVVGMGSSASIQPTLGGLLNPVNIVKGILSARHPALRDIIAGFHGVVRPGEMLLVLGRPGSGCSTFLKVLANQRKEYHSVEGEMHYDSLTPQQVAKTYRGDVQYCPEDDLHFATLTVAQTIHFAASTRAPQSRIANQTRTNYIHEFMDVLSTLFGLKHVQNTQVGDASIRGISGGEKKRVSISETLATRSLITSWDNSTRGLDSSTALEFARALRIATDLSKDSTIVSIYQAGESLFEIFDKVCLIYEGKMVYYGPANLARQYFINMGYVPADRQTTPDFLVSVTDPLGRTAVTKDNDTRPSEYKGRPVPQTAADFEECYRNSDIWNINRKDIEDYKRDNVSKQEKVDAFKESAKAEHAQHTRHKSPYTISIPMQARIVMVRRMQIMKGNYTAQALSTTSFVLQAVIVGTTFVKIPDATSAYFSRGGVLFFAVFIPALFSMSEIPALFAQRPIILRHKKAAMYHPMVEALAMTLVDVPFTLITIIIYTVIIYFVVKLQQTASQFFIFFVFVMVVALAMKAFFRGLASAFPKEAPAQAVAGVLLLALSLYTGYQIPRPSMIGALRWISYINPIFYAFEGIIVNEFHTLDGICSTLVPSGPGYEGISLNNQVCTVVGSQPGEERVDGARYLDLSFGYSYRHLWRNFGIVIAFGIFFLLWYLFFSEFNTGHGGDSSVLLFKGGSNAQVLKEAQAEVAGDEEKGQAGSTPVGSETSSEDAEKSKVAMHDQPKMINTFSWQHINYSVVVSGESRQLLDDVSGYVAPGKLTALMGESGAGKTTLLNVLAEREDAGIVTGERLFNGQRLPSDFQAQTGYCQQTDTHVPTTTVREALRFSARLRQPFSVPTSEKDAYAEKCLHMCGLEAFADAMVGTLGVEQKKRTTIGVELAAKPQLLLFLDEPTSGLDSQSAWAIMSFLRSLADNGQAILCTLPSAELFSVFDRLLLLRKGGQTVYFGDVGKNSQNIINYFEKGGARKCGPGENPAEYMLDVIGAGATAVSDRDWHDVWLHSAESEVAKKDIENIHEEGRKHPPVDETLKTQFASPWFYQTRMLLLRQHLAYWRDPTYLMSKLSLNIIGGLFIGFTFFKAKDSIQGSQNKLFAIFMGTILSAPLGQQLHVPHIKMRNIYEIRERASRMYHWSALTTSQIALELPWNILGATLFFFCWYWTVGFESSRGGFTYLMYGVCFPIYYTTAALAIASMSPTAEIAGLMYSFMFAFIFTFDGVVQPFGQLGWWKWMYHVSPYTYLIEAILGQAVGGQLINCSEKEFLTLQPPSGQTCGQFMAQYLSNRGGYLTNSDASSGCQFCPSRTTDEWMGPTFNIYYRHHWRDFGIFCAYIIFNLFLVYLLTYLVRIRTHRHLAAVSKYVKKAADKTKKTKD